MAFTSHGHHIPGTTYDRDGDLGRVNCGGTNICQRCNQEAIDAVHKVTTDPQELTIRSVFDKPAEDESVDRKALTIMTSLGCTEWNAKRILQEFKAQGITIVGGN
jgi:hypothetical protein